MTYGSVGRYRVLDFIREFVDEKGYPPTYAEIASGVGLSSLATVHKHVHNLEMEGLIVLRPGARKMSIRLTVCPKCHHEFEGHP